jgi:hypothetical protein
MGRRTAPFLADVGGSITANTFVIGLGQPENISTAALNTLTQGHNGYLLVTGTLTPDQSARLNKYFLQVLAGITNANIVLDPHGTLTPGITHRIPFAIAEPDYGMDVFLLTPIPGYIDFEIEAPNGELFSPASAGVLTNMQYVQTPGLGYYRLSLPANPAHGAGTHVGTWKALLRIDYKKSGIYYRQSYAVGGQAARGGLPYDIVVHCYTNLVFKAYVQQSSFEPSARVFVTLREYDVPVDHRAISWAEVSRPDGSSFTLALTESDPGRFTGNFTATIAGLYTIRARARGADFQGTAFEREQTLSAAVYPGGDSPPKTGGPDWCGLLQCLVKGGVIDAKALERLRALGINIDALLECLKEHCKAAPRR